MVSARTAHSVSTVAKLSDRAGGGITPAALPTLPDARIRRLLAGLLSGRSEQFVHPDHCLGGCRLLAVGIVRQ